MDYRYNQNRYAGGYQRPASTRQQLPGISEPMVKPYSRNMFGGEMGHHGQQGLDASLSVAPHALNGVQPAPSPQDFNPVNAEAASGASAAKGSGFSLANIGGNIKDLQGFIDRMGGLDGILSTVQKVQKVVSSVQSMAPLIKTLVGSFGSKSVNAASSDDEEEFYTPPVKRKKRRKKRTSSSKRRPRR